MGISQCPLTGLVGYAGQNQDSPRPFHITHESKGQSQVSDVIDTGRPFVSIRAVPDTRGTILRESVADDGRKFGKFALDNFMMDLSGE